jgi:hypothetical protein
MSITKEYWSEGDDVEGRGDVVGGGGDEERRSDEDDVEDKGEETAGSSFSSLGQEEAVSSMIPNSRVWKRKWGRKV